MAEPLSSTASVIAVVACVADSAKFLFKFFHEVSRVPENIRHLLTALKSLHITLTTLQECGKRLDPNWHFSSHFRQRLGECLSQLEIWSGKISKIDNDLDKKRTTHHKLERKTRRSWQKIKWLTAGKHDLNHFLEMIKLYHAEFSLELLTLLIAIHGSLPSEQIPGASNQANPAGPGESLPSPGTEFQPRIQSCEAVTLSNHVVHNSQFIKQTQILTPYEGLEVKQQFTSPHSGPKERSPRWNAPQQCIRAWLLLRSNFPFLNFLLRVGPVTTLQLGHAQSTCSPYNRHSSGFGVDISLSLANRICKRLSVELFIINTTALRRISLTTFWSLDCVRIVPQNADIFQCVRNGSIDGARRLLASGQASAKDVTKCGITLLHTASSRGHIDLIKVLIEAGADVNTPDEDGETPLHRAMSTKNNYDVARLLLENGADLANVAVGNRTPLHSIFNTTIGMALTHGDWIENVGPDSERMSIIHYLAWSSKTTPKIFERGRARDTVDLWSADSSGRTCLHYAASRGNVALLTYLLERASPFELEMPDNHGCTAVHYAVRSSRMLAVLELLLAKGVKLYATDFSLRNVLHHAAKWSKLEAIQQLVALDPGRSLLSPDKSGQWPHECARDINLRDVYEFLESLKSKGEFTGDATGQVHAKTTTIQGSVLIDQTQLTAWQICVQGMSALPKVLSLAFSKRSIEVLVLVSLHLFLFLMPDMLQENPKKAPSSLRG